MRKRRGYDPKPGVMTGGGVGLAAALCLAAAVGSPLPVLRLLNAPALLPPLWIMGLLWLGALTLAGIATGYALACPTEGGERETARWRGMTLLVLQVTFAFAWYSLLFGSFLLLPSWVCLLAAVGAGGLCAWAWGGTYRLSALAIAAVTLWLLLLSLLQLALMLGC